MVIDSQGDLIRTISGLQVFADYPDKLCLIDPHDIDQPSFKAPDLKYASRQNELCSSISHLYSQRSSHFELESWRRQVVG